MKFLIHARNLMCHVSLHCLMQKYYIFQRLESDAIGIYTNIKVKFKKIDFLFETNIRLLVPKTIISLAPKNTTIR